MHTVALARRHCIAMMLIGAVALWATLRLQAGERHGRDEASALPKLVSGRDLAEIEQQYESARKSLPALDGKSRYDAEMGILCRLVDARCGDDPRSLRTLGLAVIDKTREGRKDGTFEEGLFGVIIMTLVENGQRDALVELLARKCPSDVSLQTPTKFCLVVEERAARLAGKPAKLRDGILVLLDAYERAREGKSRASVLKRIRIAFPNIHAAANDDRSFVSSCRRWYLANRERIVPNGEYDGSSRGGPLFVAPEADGRTPRRRK